MSTLSVARATQRSDWLRVVFAIRAVSDDNGYPTAGLGIAMDFSRTGTCTFIPKDIEVAYWDRGMKRISFGSLKHWMKEDVRAETSGAVEAILAELNYAFVEDEEGFESRAEEEEEVDTYAPLRKSLQVIGPDFFKGITRKHFHTSTDGKVVQLRDPTLTAEATLSLSKVFVAGVEIGDVAPGMAIENMDCYVKQIRRKTLFKFDYDNARDRITLTDCTSDLSSLELSDISRKQPTGRIDLNNLPVELMKPATAKTIVDAVKRQVFKHMDDSLGATSGTSQGFFNVTFNQTIHNNVLVVRGGKGGEGGDGDSWEGGGGTERALRDEFPRTSGFCEGAQATQVQARLPSLSTG